MTKYTWLMALALLILCTAPAKDDTASTLARGLVEARLAACVNILPEMRSVYRWQGEIHEDPEVQLLIKTRPELFAEIEQWIRQHHPYDVPELIALPVVQGSPAYLEWLQGETTQD
jgi:periplasmic divalent cation tolerance protein